jgi:hypothetical protein
MKILAILFVFTTSAFAVDRTVTADSVAGTLTWPASLPIGAGSATSLSISGTAGAGFIDLGPESSTPSTPGTNHTRLYSVNSGVSLSMLGSNGFVLTLGLGNLTAARSISFPDAGGNILLDTATQTVTNKIIGTSQLSGTVAVANGGTNIGSYAVGDILYASGSTTLSKLADVATGKALISGGVTTAPSWGTIAPAAISGFPKFHTSGAASQTGIANSTETALNFGTTDFDTSSCITRSSIGGVTATIFTPTVAGYYHFTASVSLSGFSGAGMFIQFYNGSTKICTNYHGEGNGNLIATISADIFCNGSTDAIHVKMFQTSGSTQATTGDPQYDYFSGFLEP